MAINPQNYHAVITYLSGDLRAWCIKQAIEEKKSLAEYISYRLSFHRAEYEENPDLIED
jgi:hypothetical protein